LYVSKELERSEEGEGKIKVIVYFVAKFRMIAKET
jgi:hypothetical protein